jgi:predicted permease
MMGRLRPGVRMEQAEAILASPFAQWVATTASNDRERANLPILHLANGGGGLDSLKRKYTKPLYVLLAIVGLILAIACVNIANLLLARAAARKREMAVRISIGAGRWRLIRQLLTESAMLSFLGAGLGILFAIWGIGFLTRLLANGQNGFTLHAELNWRVLLVTSGLALLCGMLFGLVPALQATRPALTPSLNERSGTEVQTRLAHGIPRLRPTQLLVVTQIGISLLLLVGAGLFVGTLSNLHAVPLGYNRDALLLFDLNPLQAGYPESRAVTFYDDVRHRLQDLPGVTGVTLSHASLVRAGRQFPVSVNGVPAKGTRILQTGPDFFSTLQISILRGRGIEERDLHRALPVAVVSDLFERTWFGEESPVGRPIRISLRGKPLDVEVVGVAATARYGGLKAEVPPVVYLSYAPSTNVQQVTFALRTAGDPLASAPAVRQVVKETDPHVPVTNIRTQAGEIESTINQEIVFARLCTGFAILALVIACVGLYATMAYMVARRTSEMGIRMALGARPGLVVRMVLSEVFVLATIGVSIGIPLAFATSRFVASFLFGMQPNDPRAITMAVSILLSAALVAGYGPARTASRVDPIVALRHE